MEQDLPIKDTGLTDKNGKPIKNLTLKTRVDKKTGAVEQGLTVGNYVIVEKIFVSGYKNDMGSYAFYSCKANYKGEEVSFLLNEKEHEQYEKTGGIGDKVKITLENYNYTFKGKEKVGTKLTFSLV